MKFNSIRGLLLATGLLIASPAFTAENSKVFSVNVQGDVQQTVSLKTADFASLPRAKVDLVDKAGVMRHYEGVLVSSLLIKANPVFPAEIKNAEYRIGILVQGRDGYASLLSMAEVSANLSTNPALLADTMDGVPLSETDGPIRLVVPSDIKPTRWIKQVEFLSVKYF